MSRMSGTVRRTVNGLAVLSLSLGLIGEAAVLPRTGGAGQGTPLLIGPPTATSTASPAIASSSGDDTSSDDITAAITAPVTASITSSSATSQSSSAVSHTTTSETDSSTPSTTALSESSTTSAASAVQDLHSDSPRQPSSIRYLVPVFLLILATLGVFFFNKYRKRKARRASRNAAEGGSDDPFGGTGGWKEIKGEEEHDDDDPWDAGEDAKEVRWKEVDLREADSRKPFGLNAGIGASRKSFGMVSAASKGWGWRDTFENWRSARGKNNDGLADLDGREPTMKLVTPTMATYHTLPNLDGKPYEPDYDVNDREIDEGDARVGQEAGSISALRDKLTSLSYAAAPPPSNAGLARNKSPNKRSTPAPSRAASDRDCISAPRGTAPPPSPPAWIRPRAVSPTTILSPPLHPHLFFHPNPATSMQSMQSLASAHGDRELFMTNTDDGISCSEYASEAEWDGESAISVCSKKEQNASVDTKRFPRIPSTASALANDYDLAPSSPSKIDDGREKASTLDRAKRTPSSAAKAGLKRNPTAPSSSGSRLKPPPSPRGGRRTSTTSTSTASSPAPFRSLKPSSPLPLKRSTAVQDLSKPSSSSSSSAPSAAATPSRTRSAVSSGLSPLPAKMAAESSSLATTAGTKKSRVDRTTRREKEQRARDKVEDILKASWSDRALTSPTIASTQSISGQFAQAQAQAQAQSQSQADAGSNEPAKQVMIPGMMSPGLDSVGAGAGAGIEQRLALLRKMEV